MEFDGEKSLILYPCFGKFNIDYELHNSDLRNRYNHQLSRDIKKINPNVAMCSSSYHTNNITIYLRRGGGKRDENRYVKRFQRLQKFILMKNILNNIPKCLRQEVMSFYEKKSYWYTKKLHHFINS